MAVNWDDIVCIIPIITPFRDDFEVDEDGLRALVEFLIAEQRADAIIPCGTTGESPTLSHAEHRRVIELVVEAVDGRVPVIAGAGSNSTREAVELTKAAQALGCDATLQVGPYYNRPSQAGMIEHYTSIAEATPLPVIIYNIPSRTGRNIEPDTVVQLSKVETIIGLKDASGDINQAGKILRATRGKSFYVWAGEDALLLPLLALGGQGAVAAVAHVMGHEVCDMAAAVKNGDLAAARSIYDRTSELIGALFCEPNPAPVKQALEWLGQPAGTLRPPLTGMTDAGKKRLREALIAAGKLV
ncbi:MAG: 4-hydroxy-tetrahydrodipicolinate synthase [Actinobacteria bacterium]|nr:MAG: 4-hydroxy-tetrahydrodipicolinate synthase [Actinomycetota bacterium]